MRIQRAQPRLPTIVPIDTARSGTAAGQESFFAKLTNAFLRRMRVESKQELQERIERYIDRLNENPVTYKWPYKMDEISVA